MEKEDFKSLASDSTLQFRNAGLVFVGATVAAECFLSILAVFLLPALNEERRKVMFASHLSKRQSGFEFAQDLLLELSGVISTYLYNGDGKKRVELISGARTTLVWDGEDYLQARS